MQQTRLREKVRTAAEELGYNFRFVYNMIGHDMPMKEIHDFLTAASAIKQLRKMRVGTMGYRDMLLYGTQFEGFSLRRDIGVEVEPYEMLEMVRAIDTLDPAVIAEEIEYIQKNWVMDAPCDPKILEQGVRYALAIGKKIEERGWDDPAPQLVSLEVETDTPVSELAQKIACQHVIVAYGDHRPVFEEFAKLLNIPVI